MPPAKKPDKAKSGSGKPGRPGSKEGQRVLSRASTATSKAKESAVLSDGSLCCLAREVAMEKVNGLVLVMLLNLPTTTIVNACNDASEVGLIEASDALMIDTTRKLLLTWKSMRVGSKEKEKVGELERALKVMGKVEWAEAVNDRHANQTELTPDAFSS